MPPINFWWLLPLFTNLILLFVPSSFAQLSCHRIPTSFCCTTRIREQCPEQCANVQCGEEFIHSLFSIDGSPRAAARDGSANIGQPEPSFTFTKPDSMIPNSGDAHFLPSISPTIPTTPPSNNNEFPTLIPSTSAVVWEVTTPFPQPPPSEEAGGGFGLSGVATTRSSGSFSQTIRNGHRRRTTPDPRIIRPPESLVVIGDYDEDEPPSENAVVDSQIPFVSLTSTFAPPSSVPVPPAPSREASFLPSDSESSSSQSSSSAMLGNFGEAPTAPIGSNNEQFRSRKEIDNWGSVDGQQKGEVSGSGSATSSVNRDSNMLRRGELPSRSPALASNRLICRIMTPGRLVCNHRRLAAQHQSISTSTSRFISMPSRHPIWRGDIRKQPPKAYQQQHQQQQLKINMRDRKKKKKIFATNRIHISPFSGGYGEGELLRRRRKLDSGSSAEWKVSLIPRGQNRVANPSINSIPPFTIDGKSDERFNKFYRTIDKVIHKLELTQSGDLHVRGEHVEQPSQKIRLEGNTENLNVESSAVLIVPRTTIAPGVTNKVNVLPFRPIHFTAPPPQPKPVFTHPPSSIPPPPPSGGQCGIAPDFTPCVSNEIASRSLLECCKRKNLPIGCQSLCRYDITQAEIRAAMDRGQCGIFSVAPFLECASQGKDNSECCRHRGIIQKTGPQCEQFCRPGQGLSALGIQHIICGNAVGDMLHCHHSGVRI